MCVAALALWAGSWRRQDPRPVPTSACRRGHMVGSPGHAGATLPWPWALAPVHTPRDPAFVLTPFKSPSLRDPSCPACCGPTVALPALGWGSRGHPLPLAWAPVPWHYGRCPGSRTTQATPQGQAAGLTSKGHPSRVCPRPEATQVVSAPPRSLKAMAHGREDGLRWERGQGQRARPKDREGGRVSAHLCKLEGQLAVTSFQ